MVCTFPVFCLLGRLLYSSTTSLRCGLGLVSKVCCTHQSPLTSTVKMEVMWAKTARSYAQATVFYTPGKMWKRERHTHNIQLCGLRKNNFETLGSLVVRWGSSNVGVPPTLGSLGGWTKAYWFPLSKWKSCRPKPQEVMHRQVFYTPGKMWKRERHTHNIQLCGLWKNNSGCWGPSDVGVSQRLDSLEHWGPFDVVFWSLGPWEVVVLVMMGFLGHCGLLDI